MSSGLLYTGSPEQLIAAVNMTVARRAEYTVSRYKGDNNWDELVPEEAAITLRITATGITTPAWINTLITRQDGGIFETYRASFDEGDQHQGPVAVEQLDERVEGDYRRFVLILRSSGMVVYTPPV